MAAPWPITAVKLGAGYSWPTPENFTVREPKGWVGVETASKQVVLDIIAKCHSTIPGGVSVAQTRMMPDFSLALDIFFTRQGRIFAETMTSIANFSLQIINVVCDLKQPCMENPEWRGAVVVYISTAAHSKEFPNKSNIAAVLVEKKPDSTHDTVKFHTSHSRWLRPALPGVPRNDKILLRELARSLISLQGERAHAGTQRIFELTGMSRCYQICTTDFRAPLTVEHITLATQLSHNTGVHVNFDMKIDDEPGALVFSCQLPNVVKRTVSSSGDRSVRRVRGRSSVSSSAAAASSGAITDDEEETVSDSESEDDHDNEIERKMRVPSRKRAVRFSDSQADSPFGSLGADDDDDEIVFTNNRPAPGRSLFYRIFGWS